MKFWILKLESTIKIQNSFFRVSKRRVTLEDYACQCGASRLIGHFNIVVSLTTSLTQLPASVRRHASCCRWCVRNQSSLSFLPVTFFFFFFDSAGLFSHLAVFGTKEDTRVSRFFFFFLELVFCKFFRGLRRLEFWGFIKPVTKDEVAWFLNYEGIVVFEWFDLKRCAW